MMDDVFAVVYVLGAVALFVTLAWLRGRKSRQEEPHDGGASNAAR
jgi:hypothetical protein